MLQSSRVCFLKEYYQFFLFYFRLLLYACASRGFKSMRLKASNRSYQSSRRLSTYKNRELLYVSRGTPARVAVVLHIHTLAKSIATWEYEYSQH